MSIKSARLTNRPLGNERVYLPLFKVADTPSYIQGDEMFSFKIIHMYFYPLEVVGRSSEAKLQVGKF